MADMVELTDGNGDASAGETAVESSKLISYSSTWKISKWMIWYEVTHWESEQTTCYNGVKVHH